MVEDAAQAIDSFYKGKALGGVGHLGAFSFHETKNITAGGEGGLLVINDETYYDVVTDDWTSFWTSVKTFERLSTQIPMDILKSFIISGANVLSHEGMIPISKDFMSYVKENTNHPKFLPKFLLLEKNVIKINEEEQLENVDYSFTPESQNIELPMSRKR